MKKGVTQVLGNVILVAAVITIGTLLLMYGIQMFQHTSYKAQERVSVITSPSFLEVIDANMVNYGWDIGMYVTILNRGSNTFDGNILLVFSKNNVDIASIPVKLTIKPGEIKTIYFSRKDPTIQNEIYKLAEILYKTPPIYVRIQGSRISSIATLHKIIFKRTNINLISPPQFENKTSVKFKWDIDFNGTCRFYVNDNLVDENSGKYFEYTLSLSPGFNRYTIYCFSDEKWFEYRNFVYIDINTPTLSINSVQNSKHFEIEFVCSDNDYPYLDTYLTIGDKNIHKICKSGELCKIETNLSQGNYNYTLKCCDRVNCVEYNNTVSITSQTKIVEYVPKTTNENTNIKFEGHGNCEIRVNNVTQKTISCSGICEENITLEYGINNVQVICDGNESEIIPIVRYKLDNNCDSYKVLLIENISNLHYSSVAVPLKINCPDKVTDALGNVLPYWCNKIDGTVYVKIGLNDKNAIVVYYGGNKIKENGDLVFEFFDDFDVNSIESKWKVVDTTRWITGYDIIAKCTAPKITNGKLIFDNGYCTKICGNYEIAEPVIYEVYGYDTGFGSADDYASCIGSDINEYGWSRILDTRCSGSHISYQGDWTTNFLEYSTNSGWLGIMWNNFVPHEPNKLILKYLGENKIEGISIVNEKQYTYGFYPNHDILSFNKPCLVISRNVGTAWFDYVLVRKYLPNPVVKEI